MISSKMHCGFCPQLSLHDYKSTAGSNISKSLSSQRHIWEASLHPHILISRANNPTLKFFLLNLPLKKKKKTFTLHCFFQKMQFSFTLKKKKIFWFSRNVLRFYHNFCKTLSLMTTAFKEYSYQYNICVLVYTYTCFIQCETMHQFSSVHFSHSVVSNSL